MYRRICQRPSTRRATVNPVGGRSKCQHVESVGPMMVGNSSVSMSCGVLRTRSHSASHHQPPQVTPPMNQYGQLAMTYWQQHKPTAFATIQDPEDFFSTLGETAAAQVDQLADHLAGPDHADEGFLGKVGRLRMAKLQAEEVVLADLVYSALPERPAEEDDEEPNPVWELKQQMYRQEREDREQEDRERKEELDRDWR